MTIGNVELMHECFPKHSCMGSARMLQDKETEEVKNRAVGMEEVKRASNKKEAPTA